MEIWLQRGRPALFEALGNVCRTLDHEFQAELLSKKPQLKDAGTNTMDEDGMQSSLAVIKRLEKENANLRTLLSVMVSSSDPNVATTDHQNHGVQMKGAPTLDAPCSPSSATTSSRNAWCSLCTQSKEEAALLQLKFNALADNFKTAKEALQVRKEEREKWSKYANFLRRRIKSAEERHGIRILGRRPEGTDEASFCSDDGIAAGETTLSNLPLTASNFESTPDDPHLQSTQGDPEEESEELPALRTTTGTQCDSLIIKNEPSSDVPIMVSEKVLKKRKIDDTCVATTRTSRIKIEENEDSPIASIGERDHDTQESLDLDDIAQRMATPRKRKDGSISGDDSSGWTVAPHSPSRLFVHPEPLRSVTKIVREATVLTPISVNKRLVRSAPEKLNAPAVKKALAHGISVLAEDGSVYGTENPVAGYKSLVAPNSVIKGRLNSLLNSPAAEHNSPISRPVQTPRAVGTSTGDQALRIPGRRDLPFEKSARQSTKRTSAGTSLTSWLSKSGQETPSRVVSSKRNLASTPSLRQQPPSELQLDDFKINPLSNEGHDFAFSEVVRDKTERACLRGCTDLHCCGKQFRALALSQRPNPPLTPTQRIEERELLESYLGDYAYRLATITNEERAELWVEAKTEELANKYGRHRHRFSRMQSPPGFWNADFPDTQELEADREEASKREKRVIAERYREALRPGGRWVFRDE